MPNWSWFDLNFQWIGGAAAVVLLVLLFGTNLLRVNQHDSRWRDYTWLSWLGMAAYLLHNVEEYGIDMFGRRMFESYWARQSRTIRFSVISGLAPARADLGQTAARVRGDAEGRRLDAC